MCTELGLSIYEKGGYQIVSNADEDSAACARMEFLEMSVYSAWKKEEDAWKKKKTGPNPTDAYKFVYFKLQPAAVKIQRAFRKSIGTRKG